MSVCVDTWQAVAWLVAFALLLLVTGVALFVNRRLLRDLRWQRGRTGLDLRGLVDAADRHAGDARPGTAGLLELYPGGVFTDGGRVDDPRGSVQDRARRDGEPA